MSTTKVITGKVRFSYVNIFKSRAFQGPLGAFCRTYSITEAIAKFLPDVYTPTAKEDRYTYAAGSTAAGLVVYDGDVFAYSNHSTDPAGGRLCNAFDLVRIHKFGHLDEGKEDTAVSQLPSQKAMYAVTDAAYSALIKLVADICQRNGIKQLVWSTNKADRVNHVNGCNMTVHRDYANKACPGQYLYERHGAIAAAVNAILGSSTTQAPEAAPEAVQGFPETPFTARVIVPDLNYRKGPGMSYAVKGQTGKGVFTITEVQDGWGKLKSGAGWIYLENPNYCTILGVASKPPDPDPADVLAEEIAGKVKGSGLDPEDILNRVEKILGVA